MKKKLGKIFVLSYMFILGHSQSCFARINPVDEFGNRIYDEIDYLVFCVLCCIIVIPIILLLYTCFMKNGKNNKFTNILNGICRVIGISVFALVILGLEFLLIFNL